MGQTHNKVNLNQQQLHSVYEETFLKEYFTHSKGFGYRKANIQSTKHQKISQFVKSDVSSFERIQKGIMKKRFQIQTYPYSCIGLIIVSYKDRVTFGTGCLIGPNLILTTASNVYHKDSDEHPEEIRFALNINQSEGDVYRIKRDIKIPQKFVEETTGSHAYNYAILEVESRESFHDQNTTQNDQNGNQTNDKFVFPGLIYGYLGINTKFSGMQQIYIYGYTMEATDKNELKFTLRGQKINKLMCKNGSIGYKMQSSEKQCGSPILIRRNESNIDKNGLLSVLHPDFFFTMSEIQGNQIVVYPMINI